MCFNLREEKKNGMEPFEKSKCCQAIYILPRWIKGYKMWLWDAWDPQTQKARESIWKYLYVISKDPKREFKFYYTILPIISEILLFPNHTQVYHQKRPPTVFIKIGLGLFRCGNSPVWPSEETMKKVTEQYEKSENDPKALQSVGQIVGEVLKQLNEEKNYHHSYKWTKICCRLSSTAWQK